MADSDDRVPIILLTAGVTGIAALVATWLLLVTNRPRPFVLATATVAAVSALTTVLHGRRWLASTRPETRKRSDLAELARLTGHTSDILLRLDPDRSITVANTGLSSVLGHDAAAWHGRDAIELVAPDDADAVAAAFEQASSTGRPVELDVEVVDADGDDRRARAAVVPVDGGGFVLTLRDVTEHHQLVRQLSHRAYHDDLTGVANRARFLDRLEAALAVDDPRAAVLFVDLDGFKAINDRHGHAAGDQVLREVAGRIAGWVRPTDTVARLGGDEFAVLLTDVDATSARHVAEQIAPTLAAPVALADGAVEPAASIGVAAADRGDTVASVLEHADAAMYRAKRAGKGRVHVYDPTIGASTTTPFSVQLHGAPERGELRVVYLPVADLERRRVVGVEALLRWDHPERGLLTAADFLGAAERSGEMDALGRWAIERSIGDAARWTGSGLRLHVNVSATQLDAPDLADDLARVVGHHGVDPATVVVEIPEVALGGSTARDHTIDAIRRLGCTIALDGFAATRTPLQTIGDHGVGMIKLARSLSAPDPADGRALGLTGGIVAWAEAAGIATVGLAIERPEQIRALRGLGCRFGQGSAIAGPVVADDVLERIGV